MAQLIDKDALVAEINELKKEVGDDEYWHGYDIALYEVLYFINTLEVKEVQEEPVSKDYRERYKSIARSEAFKKTYEGMSVGEIMHVEGEESVWIKELQDKLDSLSKEDFEKVWSKYSQYGKGEEPVSEQKLSNVGRTVKDRKEKSVSEIDFEQELYKAFGHVKDFTLGMRIAKRFYDMGKNSQEPISKPNEQLAETYLALFDKKFPILPTLKGKQLADYKNFLNKCQQIFSLKEWGIHPIQSKLFEKLTLLWATWGAEHLQGVGRQDEKEQDIPVSEDLEKAAVEAFKQIVDSDKNNFLEIFKAGAKWQKEQLMAKAIDGHATFEFYGLDSKTYGTIAHDPICFDDFGLKDTDKVKVILIKED